MSGRRGAGIVPVIGWTLPAFVLATGLSAAGADELADLRANQELLQRRIDQLAQAQAAPGPPPSGPGSPVVAGSFPRSFLIPGTDSSIRIGGQAAGYITRYWHGLQPQPALFGSGGTNLDRTNGGGGTGNLPSIPLNNKAAAVPAHSRSSATFF